MSNTIPAARMQFAELAAKPYAAMLRLDTSIELADDLRELRSRQAPRSRRKSWPSWCPRSRRSTPLTGS
jgi:hypothetical protein